MEHLWRDLIQAVLWRRLSDRNQTRGRRSVFMRIAHIGLASYFTEDMKYQDNELAEQNVRDGHQVLYISNAEKYADGRIVPTGCEYKKLANGVRLVRLEYVFIISKFISDKIRKVRGLYGILEKFKPDVILSHDLSYSSILDVVQYKKNHENVILYADTHTAEGNSAGNWISKIFLHRIFYRWLTQCTLKYLSGYFYIGAEEKKFSIKYYGVPESMMSFFPLGTRLVTDDEYRKMREKRRKELGIKENELLFVHSGKIDSGKRTDLLLRAFHAETSLNARLVIIGVIDETYSEKVCSIINDDERICFLGWKSGDELKEYLCAGDLYCQPGSVSATLQLAAGCNSPVMSYPHQTYKMIDEGNFLWVRNENDIRKMFHLIARGKIHLADMKERSKICVHKYLDYSQTAKMIYQ